MEYTGQKIVQKYIYPQECRGGSQEPGPHTLQQARVNKLLSVTASRQSNTFRHLPLIPKDQYTLIEQSLQLWTNKTV